MKKIILSLAISSMAAYGAFAQGTVYAINGSGLLISTNGVTSGETQSSAGGYYYALLIDSSTPTSANPLTGGWTYSGVTLTNLVNGVISGGTSATANGWAVNTYDNYEIVGWSTDGGTYSTWAQVSAALSNGLTGAGLQSGSYYGISAEGNAEPGGGSPALPVWHLFGTTDSAQGDPVGGFVLNEVTVPEPGTMALAALGGASLLMFRRKK